MKKKWKQMMAICCSVAILMTMPGICVQADEIPAEEIIISEADGVEDIIEYEEESAEEIIEFEEPSENEELIEAEAIDSQEFDDEAVGAGNITVGDNVTATFDSSTGAVKFYSNGGTLWKNWINNSGIDKASIKSIQVASGTVYLPADSSRIFSVYYRDETYPDGTLIQSNLKTINLKGFNTSKVNNMSEMFNNCRALESLDLSGFDTSNVTDMSRLFSDCQKLVSLNMRNVNTSKVENMFLMFNWCTSLTALDLSSFNTSKVTNMGYMFTQCSNLKSLNISGFNTSNVTSMEMMFDGCESLSALDLSIFNTSKVTNMSCMFRDCKRLKTLDVSGFTTSLVTNMSWMFAGCESLTALDVSGFNTANVQNMEYMFASLYNVPTLDVSRFSTSKVTKMGYMFNWCKSITSLNLSGFNTSNVTDMGGMFHTCSSLTDLDLHNFNTLNVTNMFSMFMGCESLKNLNLSSFDMTKVVDVVQMFTYCSNLQRLSTPKNALPDIRLPKTMYDNAGSAYSNLPTLSKSIILTSTYQPSYTITFNANGGSVSTTSKTVTNGGTYGTLPTPTRSNYKFDGWYTSTSGGTKITSSTTVNLTGNQTLYAHWTYSPASYTITFNANGGSVSTTSKTVTNGGTYGTLPTPTRSNYKFDGWYTSTSGGTKVTSSTTVNLTGNQTLYAHWIATYTITYDANGGTGTPSPQEKEKNVSLTLSSTKPTKQYVIRYNSNGGSVSPASKSISCTFNNWNTAKNGTGTSYAPGGSYTVNADVTLYAQWANSKAGTLATPTRSGYIFAGWFTSATGGNQISSSSVISGNITIYAHWTDPYNLGDETYSFRNYGDSDSPGGHCFGMSVTSSGYENKLLAIKRIGGNDSTPLYSFRDSQIVRQPICFYQGIQGSYSNRAIVAGGSAYLSGRHNITSDWPAVVNFVKDHKYDDKGLLQIGFRKQNEGGHAINFLYYKNVNGQDRIYAYDNNFPDQEVYFYQNAYGNIVEAPLQTFSGAIDCMALRDVRIYFNSVGDFDSRYVVYMAKDAAEVEGYTYSLIENGSSDGDYVMYEIPAGNKKITINPKTDNADFIYMGTEYSFGKITDSTRGELTFSTLDENAGTTNERFVIYEDQSSPYKFSDVQDPKHPYFNAIYWAADADITKGYPDGTFGINRSCTRGEMMMFLWRYAGKQEPKTVSKSPFKDVPKTHTFYKAILWGSQKGITKGYSDGTFGVNRNVSRGECMMFLWRLKNKPAPKAVAKAPFPDVPKSHVFYNAVLWGYQKKITTGFTSGPLKGKFGVNENCSRGQIVTFLYRAK